MQEHLILFKEKLSSGYQNTAVCFPYLQKSYKNTLSHSTQDKRKKIIATNVNSRQLKLYEEKRPVPNQTKLWKHFCCGSLKQKTSFALHKLFITVLKSG